MILLVTEETSWMRIDLFLVHSLPGLSRNQAQQALRDGRIFVNGTAALKRVLLKVGDSVDLRELEPKTPALHYPTSPPLDVVYEDSDLLVVNKPAGILTHPARSADTNTLLDRLVAHCGKNLSNTRGGGMAGIVHRLDKDTSGLLMVAKNNQTHQLLAKLIEDRKVSKFYLTLLHGKLIPRTGSIEAPLLKAQRNPAQALTRVSLSPHAKWALTHYEVLEFIQQQYSFVRVQIVTGRTHQIRAHFSSIGHDVVGDSAYGSSDRDIGAPRQFLHSSRLVFTHPISGQVLDFEAPLPADLEHFLHQLRFSSSLPQL